MDDQWLNFCQWSLNLAGDMEVLKEANFGDLRSVMNQRSWSSETRQYFWQVLSWAATHVPMFEFEAYLAYMRGFPHHFDKPLQTLTSYRALVHAAAICPMGRFDVCVPFDFFEAPDTLQAMCASPVCRSIHELFFFDQTIGPAEMSIVARSPYLSSLRTLKLPHNTIGDSGVAALVASAYNFPQLCRLDLTDNHITSFGVEALSRSPLLGQLERLNLYNNPIGDHGAEMLAASRHLGALQCLDLSYCLVGDRGALALGRASHFGALDFFGLEGNALHYNAVMALVGCPGINHSSRPPVLMVGTRDVQQDLHVIRAAEALNVLVFDMHNEHMIGFGATLLSGAWHERMCNAYGPCLDAQALFHRLYLAFFF